MIDYAGQLVGEKYLVQRLLGKGGMGAVYQAEHQTLKKQVAIKFLHGKYADNDDMVKRFYREAQAAAAINHANIVSVIDVGLSPRQEPFLVMEFLEGESLAQLIKRSAPIDVSTVCGLAEPVLLGLQAAHEIGIVHRDLKPDNIFLVHQPEGAPVVKLIDFGVSKFLEQSDEARMTYTGMVLGTPSYMAPEQAMGRVDNTDARADIYAVGVILFQMLSGQLPITAENNQEMMIKVATAQPRKLGQLRSDLSPRVRQIVMKAIAKNPRDRFQSCGEMLAALRQVKGFEQRNTRITQLGLSMVDITFAGGDLGSEDTSADTLSGKGDHRRAPSTRSTPRAWAKTFRSYQAAAPKTRLAIGLAVAASLALLVVATFDLFRAQGRIDPATPGPLPPGNPAPPEAPTADNPPLAVTITVDGAPAGSQIFFDDNRAEANPFSVPYERTAKTLRVKATGFHAFTASVVPNADQRITVSLEPVRSATDPTAPSPTHRSGKKSRRPPPRQNRNVTSGRRNTLFANDYE